MQLTPSKPRWHERPRTLLVASFIGGAVAAVSASLAWVGMPPLLTGAGLWTGSAVALLAVVTLLTAPTAKTGHVSGSFDVVGEHGGAAVVRFHGQERNTYVIGRTAAALAGATAITGLAWLAGDGHPAVIRSVTSLS